MNKNTPLWLCAGYMIGFLLAKEILKTGNSQLNAHFVLGAIVGTWTYHLILKYTKILKEKKDE